MDRKTHTHKHTLKKNSLTCRLEPQSHKGATGDIKSRSANFKGAPRKVLWKNPSRKRNNVKMDLHHATHHAAPSRNTDATKTFNDFDAT